MDTGVYKITNTANGKIYLGQAVDIQKRFKHHKSRLSNNKHQNKHLQRAYNQYGASAFTFEPILYCDESLLNEYEVDLIFLSESYKPEIGYNKTMGGEGGQPTEEVKAKISAATKGKKKKPLTEEHRAKISAANKGKVLSEETRANISTANKGKVFSEETRAKISATLKDRIITEETKAKMSAAHKKRRNDNNVQLDEDAPFYVEPEQDKFS